MDVIPDDILLHIFSFLPSKSLLQVSWTNKTWRCLAGSEDLWRTRISTREQRPHNNLTPTSKGKRERASLPKLAPELFASPQFKAYVLRQYACFCERQKRRDRQNKIRYYHRRKQQLMYIRPIMDYLRPIYNLAAVVMVLQLIFGMFIVGRELERQLDIARFCEALMQIPTAATTMTTPGTHQSSTAFEASICTERELARYFSADFVSGLQVIVVYGGVIHVIFAALLIIDAITAYFTIGSASVHNKIRMHNNDIANNPPRTAAAASVTEPTAAEPRYTEATDSGKHFVLAGAISPVFVATLSFAACMLMYSLELYIHSNSTGLYDTLLAFTPFGGYCMLWLFIAPRITSWLCETESGTIEDDPDLQHAMSILALFQRIFALVLIFALLAILEHSCMLSTWLRLFSGTSTAAAIGTVPDGGSTAISMSGDSRHPLRIVSTFFSSMLSGSATGRSSAMEQAADLFGSLSRYLIENTPEPTAGATLLTASTTAGAKLSCRWSDRHWTMPFMTFIVICVGWQIIPNISTRMFSLPSLLIRLVFLAPIFLMLLLLGLKMDYAVYTHVVDVYSFVSAMFGPFALPLAVLSVFSIVYYSYACRNLVWIEDPLAM